MPHIQSLIPNDLMGNVIILDLVATRVAAKNRGICFTIAESRKSRKYGRRVVSGKWAVYRKLTVSCLTREPYFFYLSGMMSFFMVARVQNRLNQILPQGGLDEFKIKTDRRIN
jgi:hypothetical protein